MNHLFESRPLLKTGILALLMLPLVILINDLSPAIDKIPDGYNSSILAFEFASDQSELEEVLGTLTADEKSDMDKLNYVDFGFMTLYGIFLFLFMARFGGLIGDGLLAKAKWLAPIIVLADVLENIQLLKLNGTSIDASSLDGSLMLLGIFTWTKWGLLALAFACIAYAMTKMKRSKWFSIILFLPIILGVIAFLSGQRSLEDMFGTSIFLCFLVIFVYCIIYKREKA